MAGGAIGVSGVDSFEVYALNGQKVALTGLAKGVYVVRAGGVAQKVIVK